MERGVKANFLIYDWAGEQWQYYSYPIRGFDMDMKQFFEKCKHINIKGIGWIEFRDVYGPDDYGGHDYYTIRAYWLGLYKTVEELMEYDEQVFVT